jgi:hypothetical protein
VIFAYAEERKKEISNIEHPISNDEVGERKKYRISNIQYRMLKWGKEEISNIEHPISNVEMREKYSKTYMDASLCVQHDKTSLCHSERNAVKRRIR